MVLAAGASDSRNTYRRLFWLIVNQVVGWVLSILFQSVAIMNDEASLLYEFGPFRLNVPERVLEKDTEAVPLTPKVFDTLLVLVENRGHVLAKDDLMHHLWPDTFVEDSSLTQNICCCAVRSTRLPARANTSKPFPSAAIALSLTCAV